MKLLNHDNVVNLIEICKAKGQPPPGLQRPSKGILTYLVFNFKIFNISVIVIVQVYFMYVKMEINFLMKKINLKFSIMCEKVRNLMSAWVWKKEYYLDYG